jgi:CRP/FNR family transcriptional regulator
VSWEAELGQTALFAGLPDPVLADLGSRVVQRKYRKGSVVFVQGERGQRCYIIVSGSVKISAYHPDGREVVLALLGPGDVFGELSLFDEAPRSADAMVLETAELLSLDAESVHQAVRTHPEMAVSLLKIMSRRMRHTNESFQDAAFFDVTGRVARRLADLSESHGREHDEGVLIDLEISQESLANMVGATRESVNKALAGLSRRGLVQRKGRKYVIANAQELRDRAR